MSKTIDLLGSMRDLTKGLLGTPGCLLRIAWLVLLTKAVLVAKLLAAESQLVVCADAVKRKKTSSP